MADTDANRPTQPITAGMLDSALQSVMGYREDQKYVVRFGPAPLASLEEGVETEARFEYSMFLNDSSPFEDVVRTVWETILDEDQGHMLLGTYSGMRYDVDETAPCGLNELRPENEPKIVLQGYKPLFCLIRGPPKPNADSDAGTDATAETGDAAPLDFFIDYRWLDGPDDPRIQHHSGIYRGTGTP